MSDKDDDIDDLGLGDDDDFDLDDFGLDEGDMDMGLDPDAVDPTSRTAVSGVIGDSTLSFVEGFTDDKLQTVLDVGKAAIPESLSTETDLITNSYTSISDEVSKQGNKLRRDANQSLRTFKRFLPEDDSGIANKIVNKLSSWIGEDDTGGTSSGPTQAERIAGEITSLMGEKSTSEQIEEQFKEQLAFSREQQGRDVQLTEAVNIERIRKFLFEVSDRYYRSSLDINLRQLFTMDELLSVTKSGFDVFKTSFAAIIKNTALPEVVKINNSELVGQRIKEKLVDAAGSALFKSKSPITTVTDKITKSISNAGTIAAETLEAATGNVESIGSLSESGMSVGSIFGGLFADAIKSMAGKAAGKVAGDTQEGKDLIYNVKNAMADTVSFAKEYSKSDGVLAPVASAYASLAGNNKSNFTIDTVNPDAASFVDNRTKDSINKVIPQLLSKIHSEVKTSRELQVRNTPGGRSKTLKSMGITDPEDKELVYDYSKSTMSTREDIKTTIQNRAKDNIEEGLAKLGDSIVREVLTDTKLDFSNEDFKNIRQTIVEHVIETGETSAALLASTKFKNKLKAVSGTLASKLNTQYSKYVREVKNNPDRSVDILNNMLERIPISVTPHEDIARDLVSRGLVKEAIDLNLIEQNNIGVIRSNRAGIQNDILSNLSETSVSIVTDKKESLKDKLKGKTLREKAKLTAEHALNVADNIDNPDSDVPTKGFSDGIYTGDGKVKEPAGIVHKNEVVIPKKILTPLLKAVESLDTKVILDTVKTIAVDVNSKSDKYNTNTEKLTTAIDMLQDTSVVNNKDTTTTDTTSKLPTELLTISEQFIKGVLNKDIKQNLIDGKDKVKDSINTLKESDKYNTATKIKASVLTTANNVINTTKETIANLFSNDDKKVIDTVAAAVRESNTLLTKTSTLFNSKQFKSVIDVISNTINNTLDVIGDNIPDVAKDAYNEVANSKIGLKTRKFVTTVKDNVTIANLEKVRATTVDAKHAKLLTKIKKTSDEDKQYRILVTQVTRSLHGERPRGPKHIRKMADEYARAIREYQYTSTKDTSDYSVSDLIDIVGPSIVSTTVESGISAVKTKGKEAKATIDKYREDAKANNESAVLNASKDLIKVSKSKLNDGVKHILNKTDNVVVEINKLTGGKLAKRKVSNYATGVVQNLQNDPDNTKDYDIVVKAIEDIRIGAKPKGPINLVTIAKSYAVAIDDYVATNKIKDSAYELPELMDIVGGNILDGTNNSISKVHTNVRNTINKLKSDVKDELGKDVTYAGKLEALRTVGNRVSKKFSSKVIDKLNKVADVTNDGLLVAETSVDFLSELPGTSEDGDTYNDLKLAISVIRDGGEPVGSEELLIVAYDYATVIDKYIKESKLTPKELEESGLDDDALMDIVAPAVSDNLRTKAATGTLKSLVKISNSETIGKITGFVKNVLTNAAKKTDELTDVYNNNLYTNRVANAEVARKMAIGTEHGANLLGMSVQEYVDLKYPPTKNNVLADEDELDKLAEVGIIIGDKRLKKAGIDIPPKDTNPSGFFSKIQKTVGKVLPKQSKDRYTTDLEKGLDKDVFEYNKKVSGVRADGTQRSKEEIATVIAYREKQYTDENILKVDKASLDVYNTVINNKDKKELKVFKTAINNTLLNKPVKGPAHITHAASRYAEAIRNYVTNVNHNASKYTLDQLIEVVNTGKHTSDKKETPIKLTKLDKIGNVINHLFKSSTDKEAKTTGDKTSKDTIGDDDGGIWKDLTDKERDALRLEYFNSVEYKTGSIPRLYMWLRSVKNIDTGDLGTKSAIISPVFLDMGKDARNLIAEARDELTLEILNRVTGKSLKELTVEQEEGMLEVFYRSKEYKEGHITDFGIWLRSQGYRKAGTSILSRIRKKFKLSNIFKATRALDRKVMGKLYWGAAKHTIKSPLYAAKGVAVVGRAIGDRLPGGKARKLARDSAMAAAAGGTYDIPELTKPEIEYGPQVHDNRSRWQKLKDYKLSKINKLTLKGIGKVATSPVYAAKTVAQVMGAKPKKQTLAARAIKGSLRLAVAPVKLGTKLLADSLGDTVTAIPGMGWAKSENKQARTIAKIIKKSNKAEKKRLQLEDKKLKIANGELPEKTNVIGKLITYFKTRDSKLANDKEELARSKDKADKKQSRLSRFTSMFSSSTKKDDNDQPGIIRKIFKKKPSLLSTTTILLGVVALMKASGVTVTDIKDGVVKVVKGISSLWDSFKDSIKNTKALWTYFKQLPERIGLHIRKAMPFGTGNVGKYEETNLDRRVAGLAPLGEDGQVMTVNPDGTPIKPISTDVSNTEATGVLGYGALATGAAYVGGKALIKTHTGSKKVIDTSKNVINKSANLVKDASKIEKPKNTPIGKNKATEGRIWRWLRVIKKRLYRRLKGKALATALKKLASYLIPGIGLAKLALSLAWPLLRGVPFVVALSLAVFGVDLYSSDEEFEESEGTYEYDTATDTGTDTSPIETTGDPQDKKTLSRGQRKKLRESKEASSYNGELLTDKVNNRQLNTNTNIPNTNSTISVPDINRSTVLTDPGTNRNTPTLPSEQQQQVQPVINIEPNIQVTADVNLDDGKHMPVLAEMSGKSVSLQEQMLAALGDISNKLDRNNKDPIVKDKPNQHITETLPKPTIDLRRRLVFN